MTETKHWDCYERDRTRPNSGPLLPPMNWGNYLALGQLAGMKFRKYPHPDDDDDEPGWKDESQVRSVVALIRSIFCHRRTPLPFSLSLL